MDRLKVFRIIILFCSVVVARQEPSVPLYTSEIGYFGDSAQFGFSPLFTSLIHPIKDKRYVKKKDDGEAVKHPNHNYNAQDKAEHLEDLKEKYNKHSQHNEKGYKTNHHHDLVDKQKGASHHTASRNKEKGGHTKKHHDSVSHYDKFQKGRESHKSGKFGEKKGHRKGHKTKEYHNTLHRDEYHREHRFYDDAHKSGYYEKYGDHHEYFDNKEGGRKSGKSHHSADEREHHGAKGHEDKGSNEQEHTGSSYKEGADKHHDHYRKYHKARDHEGGKHYGYVH